MVVTAPAVDLRTDGPEDTRALAGALAGLCRVGDVVLLVGDLGAGKTTFAQGFGAALGVAEHVVSPTFTLVRQYALPPAGAVVAGGKPVNGGAVLRQFVHVDLYRLSHLHEVADLGLGQLVEDGGVAVVEWGEAAEPVLGDDWLRVELELDADADTDAGTDDENRRAIRVTCRGATWSARRSQVEDALGPWRTRP